MECTKCTVTGVKFWRWYSFTPVELHCCDCAALVSGADISSLSAKGTMFWENHETYEIGGLVPAIKDLEDGLFWGYTSVPKAAIQAWEKLPNRKQVLCTIGHYENYKRAYVDNGAVWKIGLRESGADYPSGYPGGYVFRYLSDAVRRIEEAYTTWGFAVFELDTTWANTYPSGNYWHHLVTDALIKWPPRIKAI